MASRVKQKEEARARRLAQEQAQLARAQRTRRMQMLGGVVLAAVIVAVVVIVISSSGGAVKASDVTGPRPLLKLGSSTALGPLQSPGSPGPLGPEGVPMPVGQPLAPAGSPGPGQSVDGISCQGGEQTLFHVHTHLTIFVNGSPRQIPYGVGIAPPRQVDQTGGGQFVASGACFSWLHTHAADGIIHIESPVQTTFTLGNFFDVWGQPLGPNQVGPAQGPVTAFYNGQHYLGNPRNIPIGNHVQIQLDVGRPLVAPETINFSSTGL
jgi:hypothetical protein